MSGFTHRQMQDYINYIFAAEEYARIFDREDWDEISDVAAKRAQEIGTHSLSDALLVECIVETLIAASESEEEETKRLAESISEYRDHLTTEEARKFLSQLPMYDENGQLKDE